MCNYSHRNLRHFFKHEIFGQDVAKSNATLHKKESSIENLSVLILWHKCKMDDLPWAKTMRRGYL